jgi:transcriptional regulator with XRE-family HTH domain
MVSGRQLRAARGLLEWSAEDLAREAGLRRATISTMESEAITPSANSINAVMAVFDKHGVEFLSNEGVAIRKHEIRVFSGKAGYRDLLDHIYTTMKRGGRICQFNFGDGRYLSYADDYVSVHLERMEMIQNLDARVLTQASEANLDATYCTYRWLDKSLMHLAPYYVYGDFVILALHEAAYKRELLSLQSKLLADRYIDQFDYFWGKAQGPKKKSK